MHRHVCVAKPVSKIVFPFPLYFLMFAQKKKIPFPFQRLVALNKCCNYASQKQINDRWKKLNSLRQVRFRISVMNWNDFSESSFWFESPEIMVIWAFPAFFHHIVIKLQFVTSPKSARFLCLLKGCSRRCTVGQWDRSFIPLHHWY